jgi:hypothetical protein
LIDAAKETPESHKTVSTERAQHTEIPLPRDKEPLRFGSTRAKFARGNMVSILRGKATNIASRGSRSQSIHGLRKTYSNVEPQFSNGFFASFVVDTIIRLLAGLYI